MLHPSSSTPPQPSPPPPSALLHLGPATAGRSAGPHAWPKRTSASRPPPAAASVTMTIRNACQGGWCRSRLVRFLNLNRATSASSSAQERDSLTSRCQSRAKPQTQLGPPGKPREWGRGGAGPAIPLPLATKEAAFQTSSLCTAPAAIPRATGGHAVGEREEHSGS